MKAQWMTTLMMVALVTGCETGEAARSVARNALAQVVAYEQQVDAKIGAEKKYYELTKANLHKGLNQQADSAEITAVEAVATRFQAATVTTNAEVAPLDLVRYGSELMDRIRTTRARMEAAEVALDQQVFSRLTKLEFDKKTLATIRKGLEELQREPSTADRAKLAWKTISDVEKKFKDKQPSSDDE